MSYTMMNPEHLEELCRFLTGREPHGSQRLVVWLSGIAYPASALASKPKESRAAKRWAQENCPRANASEIQTVQFTQAQVAEELGVCKNTARAWIKDLQSAGILERIHAGCKGQATLYAYLPNANKQPVGASAESNAELVPKSGIGTNAHTETLVPKDGKRADRCQSDHQETVEPVSEPNRYQNSEEWVSVRENGNRGMTCENANTAVDLSINIQEELNREPAEPNEARAAIYADTGSASMRRGVPKYAEGYAAGLPPLQQPEDEKQAADGTDAESGTACPPDVLAQVDGLRERLNQRGAQLGGRRTA